jgi:hypothetical protein
VILLFWIVLNTAATWHFLARTRVWQDGDSSYYYAMARSLAERGTFQDAVIGHHLFVYPGVNHPAFDYWQPLMPILVACLKPLTGDFDLAAKVTLFLFGTVLVPLAQFLFVRSAGGSPTIGLAAGVLFLSMRWLEFFRTELDSTLFSAVFLLLASTCAVCGILRRDKPSLSLSFLCGVLLASMALTRGDGLPVALVLVLFLAACAGRQRFVVTLLSMGAGLILTYSPLVARNLAIFGTPFPPAASLAMKFDSYWVLNRFQPDTVITFPPLMEFLKIRWDAFRQSTWAIQGRPLGFLCLCVMAVSLLLMHRHAGFVRDNKRVMARALILVLVVVGAFHLVGIALAPVTSQWHSRQPVPYWPLLLAGGMLGTGWLLDNAVLLCYRYGLTAFVIVAVTPFVALNPLRLLSAADGTTQDIGETAARMVPEDAVVMTDWPMNVFVYHPAGVVGIPGNGERAIIGAIDHYRVDYLILFGEKYSTDEREYSDSTVRDVFRGTKLALGDEIQLELLTTHEPFRVFRLNRVAGRRVPPHLELR